MSAYLNTANRPKWLLIQMGHLGKLMQTLPAIKGALAHNPVPVIHLVVDEEYYDLASMINGVDKVIPINRSRWNKLLADTSLSWMERFDSIQSLTGILEDEHYDRAVNLTHTPESAYIAPLTGTKDQSGLIGDRLGLKMTGKWELYYHAARAMNGMGAFNASDIHVCQAGTSVPRSNGEIIVNRDDLRKIYNLMRPTGSRKPLIAIQTGTCPASKQWGVQNYKQLIESLINRLNPRIILVGSDEEAELSGSLSRLFRDHVISLAGETKPHQLAVILKSCDLMIGGETGIIQLAAAVGIKTISIFNGQANVDLNAPYGAGHLVFVPVRECSPCDESGVCEENFCAEDVPVDAVSNAVVNTIKHIPSDNLSGDKFRLLITDFDRDGYLVLTSAQVTQQDKRRALLRELWKRELLGIQSGSEFNVSDSICSIEKEELRKLLNTAKAGSYIARDIYSALYNRRSPDHLVRAMTEVKIVIDGIAAGKGIAAMVALMHKLEQEMLRKRNSGFITELEETYSSLGRRAQYLIDADARQLHAAVIDSNLQNLVKDILP